MNVAVLLFDGAEELDIAGPWEILSYAAKVAGRGKVFSVSEKARPIVAANRLKFVADHTFDNAPPADVLIVPGGEGRIGESANPVLLQWLREQAKQAQWVMSVCTGSFLLQVAGVFEQKGTKKITTHWRYVDALRARSGLDVRADQRWVLDGRVLTAAGISAGVDAALWLAGEVLHGAQVAQEVARNLEYRPQPPFEVTFPTGA